MNNLEFKTSIFIFHRSLRIPDNLGLDYALSKSKTVVPIFIFDPVQLNFHEYFRSNAFQFMMGSLQDLHNSFTNLKKELYFFNDHPVSVLRTLQKLDNFEAIIINRDYSPYAIRREKLIRDFCNENQVKLIVVPDCLINEPELIKTQKKTNYTIFTPYYKTARNIAINPLILIDPQKTQKFTTIKFDNQSKLAEISLNSFKPNINITMKGGREEAIKILDSLKKYQNYEEERNYPCIEGTTRLSPHIKFGTVSVREVASYISNNLGNDHPLIRQLYWRDFFTYIGFHFPNVFTQSFKSKYQKIKWNKNEELFRKWCTGKTGFPIVDAGMKELNTTGFMHNRVRMIVASFLTKDLHINWQWGEKYFAQNLIDYDPAVNNGNWQWAASTGCDAQPYFRIFNPWAQQTKFDPDTLYIKKWLPNLRSIPSKSIHNLWKNRPLELTLHDYPSPIVDHKKERELALFIFKTALNKPIS